MMKRVFISYAHEDAAFLDALSTHLEVLRTTGIISMWHDGQIGPGEDWKHAIDRELDRADIVVLLVSASLLASKSCRDLELAPALRRWQGKGLCVMPVIVRACDWEATSLARLQVLPARGKPVVTWAHQDDAWTDVTRKIRIVATGGVDQTPAPGEQGAAFLLGPPPATVHPHSLSGVALKDDAASSRSGAGMGSRAAGFVRGPSVGDMPSAFSPHAESSARSADLPLHGGRTGSVARLPGRARGALVPLLIGALTATSVLLWFLLRGQPPRPSTRAENLGEPERTWVEAYGAAIDAGDVDRILALHVLPAPRFFEARNMDEAQLRKRYEGWFNSGGRQHRTGFEGCTLANIASDGSRALRCTTYVEPPFPTNTSSRVPACLVFTKDGKLASRTEIARVPECPPR